MNTLKLIKKLKNDSQIKKTMNVHFKKGGYMYELKCFNKYFTIIKRYDASKFDSMIAEARALCFEHKLQYEFTFIKDVT